MSLSLELRINGDLYGVVEVQRTAPMDVQVPTADTECTYEVRVEEVPFGTVKHRYGDGAWILARRAMFAAGLGITDAEGRALEKIEDLIRESERNQSFGVHIKTPDARLIAGAWGEFP